jgi:hypothetical protein
MELINPRSVADIGCGTGVWLSIFGHSGVADVQGVDGKWVEPTMLHIPKAAFRSVDLEKPLKLGRRFDLVLSLEVAEHLPATSAAPFINSLVELGDIVAFSAAIPHQGGTHHVNEQWPDYWARLFADHGYVAIDCLRPCIWHHEQVCWWYRQNMLLFVEEARLRGNVNLSRLAATHNPVHSLVHPGNYLRQIDSLAALSAHVLAVNARLAGVSSTALHLTRAFRYLSAKFPTAASLTKSLLRHLNKPIRRLFPSIAP